MEEKMNENYFKRLQIAGLFIISFLGMLVHTAMSVLDSSQKLFGWADSLIEALATEAATLSSVAAVAELPTHEAMSAGMFYVMVVWFALMAVPVFLPLLTDKKVWRWITAIVGLLMMFGGLLDGFAHTFAPGQTALGLSGLIISSVPGIFAVVFAFGWAKVKE